MPITYHPRAGEILICTYPADMRVPEMVKSRPVLVVSPHMKYRSNLVTIVPLSATKPPYIMPYHYQLDLVPPLPHPWDSELCWAICDHPMTVGFSRLNLIRLGKDQYGKRKYLRFSLDNQRLAGIRKAIAYGIGLQSYEE